MRVTKSWLSVAVVLLVMAGTVPSAFSQADHVRWDIVSLFAVPGCTSPGGSASAFANDNSFITVTGAGTFVAPGGGGGTSGAATGGGNWETFSPVETSTGSGTYSVTGLVRWDQAPGAPPPLCDNIGDPAERSAGLAILRVEYSDGSPGILVVSCRLVGTSLSVFEGITASKGFVDYFNAQAPVAGVDANRTLFHVRQ